jgi:hypothetical protein
MGGRRRSSPSLSLELRQEIAEGAARLMAEHGIRDFALAKRKAAERLGVRPSGGGLPSNAEIHAQLVQRQRLFEPDTHGDRLARLRRVAADIMEVIEHFRPKLVGAVLDGTATVNTAIEIHAFSDSPEAVAAALEGPGLHLRDGQRRYRFGGQGALLIPGFEFAVEGDELEVMVFPERASGHAPLSPVDGRPMRRAARSAVIALLATVGG